MLPPLRLHINNLGTTKHMNTGQSLFSIGALLLLSLTVLRVNNSILITDGILQDSKLGVLATSIAPDLHPDFQNVINMMKDYWWLLHLCSRAQVVLKLFHGWNKTYNDKSNKRLFFINHKIDTISVKLILIRG